MHRLWKVIGRDLSNREFASCLQRLCCSVDRLASEAVEQLTIEASGRHESLRLVRISARELGFENDVAFAELWKKAHQAGLDLLPEDAAIHLCNAWALVEWPHGKIAWVISKPIKTAHDVKCLLGVGRIRTGWLRAKVFDKATLFGPDDTLICGVHKDLHVYP